MTDKLLEQAREFITSRGGGTSPDFELDAEICADFARSVINTPHTHDWIEAVKLEATHQIYRWGTDHDRGKEPSDWLWLLGWLAGKAVHAAANGDTEKAKHHTISSGAVFLNWYRRMVGEDKTFQPGVAMPEPNTSND